MLDPGESELRGLWITSAAGVIEDPICQRSRALVKSDLQLVATSPDGWQKLYRDPSDQRHWELFFPESHMQGGGPPMLRLVPAPDSWRALTLPSERVAHRRTGFGLSSGCG
jgi:hypothetical protein